MQIQVTGTITTTLKLKTDDRDAARKNTEELRKAGSDIVLPPGVVYVDLSDGPALHLKSPGSLTGHATSTLHGLNPKTTETPVIQMERPAGLWMTAARIANLTVLGDGAGIHVVRPGHRFAVQNVLVTVKQVGIAIWEADGLRFDGVAVYGCGAEGVVVHRWHAGSLFLHCHGCAGTGFKARQVRGTHVEMLRCESNREFGFDIEDCDSYGDSWNCWCENNNFRDTQRTHTGHAYRQYRMRRCNVHICGHVGEGDCFRGQWPAWA